MKQQDLHLSTRPFLVPMSKATIDTITKRYMCDSPRQQTTREMTEQTSIREVPWCNRTALEATNVNGERFDRDATKSHETLILDHNYLLDKPDTRTNTPSTREV
jgi:hypothetical protein